MIFSSKIKVSIFYSVNKVSIFYSVNKVSIFYSVNRNTVTSYQTSAAIQCNTVTNNLQQVGKHIMMRYHMG